MFMELFRDMLMILLTLNNTFQQWHTVLNFIITCTLRIFLLNLGPDIYKLYNCQGQGWLVD